MAVIVRTAVVLSMIAMVTAGPPPCPTLDHFDSCLKTENATKDDLEGLTKKDITLITPAGKCALACVLEKSEIVVNGTFSSARIMETYKPCLPPNATFLASLEKALEKCEKDVGTVNERCEEAFKVAQCYFKYNEEVVATISHH